MNHRDIRRWVLFVLALCLLITAILLLTAPQLVLPFLLSALLWNAVSAALIHLVNRRIRTLSDQLMRVYSNSLHTDIRDNEEGALSILRNDIYKITRTFHEQQKQSEKDRLFLSDTISDISHQLRTPLTSMRMMNELLQQDLPEAQRQEFFSWNGWSPPCSSWRAWTRAPSPSSLRKSRCSSLCSARWNRSPP